MYIYQLGHSKNENQHLHDKQRIYELERKEFNSLCETTERLRKMKHDMQIYVDAINLLVKNKKWNELITYTEQYNKTLATTNTTIATGNVAIDCILTAKLDPAEQLNIKTKYSIITPEIFPLDSVELSSLLGNLWNNAIEACEKIEEDKRTIEVEAANYNTQMFIEVRNSYDNSLVMYKDRIITTKADKKNHGIGLENIRRVVKKYDGKMTITPDKEWFIVTISL